MFWSEGMSNPPTYKRAKEDAEAGLQERESAELIAPFGIGNRAP